MSTYKHGGYLHNRELPSPKQFKAAMAVAGVDYRTLAREAETCTRTLVNFLRHRRPVYPGIAEKMRSALERRGIQFVFGDDFGIRFKSDSLSRER